MNSHVSPTIVRCKSDLYRKCTATVANYFTSHFALLRQPKWPILSFVEVTHEVTHHVTHQAPLILNSPTEVTHSQGSLRLVMVRPKWPTRKGHFVLPWQIKLWQEQSCFVEDYAGRFCDVRSESEMSHSTWLFRFLRGSPIFLSCATDRLVLMSLGTHVLDNLCRSGTSACGGDEAVEPQGSDISTTEFHCIPPPKVHHQSELAADQGKLLLHFYAHMGARGVSWKGCAFLQKARCLAKEPFRDTWLPAQWANIEDSSVLSTCMCLVFGACRRL